MVSHLVRSRDNLLHMWFQFRVQLWIVSCCNLQSASRATILRVFLSRRLMLRTKREIDIALEATLQGSSSEVSGIGREKEDKLPSQTPHAKTWKS